MSDTSDTLEFELRGVFLGLLLGVVALSVLMAFYILLSINSQFMKNVLLPLGTVVPIFLSFFYNSKQYTDPYSIGIVMGLVIGIGGCSLFAILPI